MVERTAEYMHTLFCDLMSGRAYLLLKKARLLQAFPTESALADALRRQKPFLANKKRLSRLKRIILKERGEKALVDAREASGKAALSLLRAEAQRDSIQEQLKV